MAHRLRVAGDTAVLSEKKRKKQGDKVKKVALGITSSYDLYPNLRVMNPQTS